MDALKQNEKEHQIFFFLKKKEKCLEDNSVDGMGTRAGGGRGGVDVMDTIAHSYKI